MKAVFVVFNQALTERVYYMLDRLEIKGYTFWENVQGRGSKSGDPRQGTHTWPEMNSSVLAMVKDEKVSEILESVQKMDALNKEVGIRAFVWTIEQTV